MDRLKYARADADRLRILIMADPEIPVPPTHYGGIERIVDFLARGLLSEGHDVHLCANKVSSSKALACALPGNSSLKFSDTVTNMVAVWQHFRDHRPFDLVHSFSRLAYTLPFLIAGVPVLQSYQRHITASRVKLATLIARGAISFSACSQSCAGTGRSARTPWNIIYNGVDVRRFPFQQTVPDDAPLVFVGRIERIKGVHHAISAALETGRKLIIAGTHADTGEHFKYFKERVLSFCDGEQIRFIGPVNDRQKAQLLGNAAALLFPIEWEEPFGIVMVEALACGTPVIAFRRGAVPEVIDDGQTGYICDTADDMNRAIKVLTRIDRSLCRAVVEARFSSDVIVSRYEDLYRRLIAH